jgi:hypothetical protein
MCFYYFSCLVHLNHEKILKAQQTAMISAVDLELKEVSASLKYNLAKERKNVLTDEFINYFRCIIQRKELPVVKNHALRDHLNSAFIEVEQIANEYSDSKLRMGMKAINKEMQDFQQETSAKAKRQNVKNPPDISEENRLRLEIQQKMEFARNSFKSSSKQLEASINAQNRKKLKLVEYLVDQNMKLAAQISILKHFDS